LLVPAGLLVRSSLAPGQLKQLLYTNQVRIAFVGIAMLVYVCVLAWAFWVALT
jgi:hypothetical protein